MKNIIYILLILILQSSCDDKNCYIQEVYVNESIDLNLHSELTPPGSSIFIEGGVEGIIIHHQVGDSYKAYDRNCSYNPCSSCSYIDSLNSGYAICGCCPSVFDLNNDGAVLNTPALLPLKSYSSSLENNILRISN